MQWNSPTKKTSRSILLNLIVLRSSALMLALPNLQFCTNWQHQWYALCSNKLLQHLVCIYFFQKRFVILEFSVGDDGSRLIKHRNIFYSSKMKSNYYYLLLWGYIPLLMLLCNSSYIDVTRL